MLFNDLRKEELNKRNLKLALSYSKKTNLFSSLVNLLTNIQKASSNNFKAKTYRSYCFQSYDAEPIVDLFSSRFDRFCRSKLLKYITPKTIGYNGVKSALNKNLSFYLTSRYLSEFSTFMSEIRKHKKTKLIIYDLLKASIATSEKLPPMALLTELELDIHWTRSIQSLAYNNPSKKIEFRQEFNKLKRKFYKFINKEELVQAVKAKNDLFTFYKANKPFISASYARSSLLNIGDRLVSMKLYKESKKTYTDIGEIFYKENDEEITFKKLWVHLDQKEIGKAYSFIQSSKLLSRFDSLPPRLQFWTAFTLEKKGEKKTAEQLFLNIIENRPLHYYSILSYRSLSEKHQKNIEFVSSSPTGTKQFRGMKKLLSKISLKYLKRISLWSKHGNTTFIEHEVRGLFNLPKREIFKKRKISRSLSSDQLDNILIHRVTKTLNEFGQYLPSFKVIYKGLSEDKVVLSDDILKSLFPNSLIEKISKLDDDLNPYFVLSLIRQESAFNPTAKSSAGARGLMQLMPNTARQYKKSLRSSHLENPNLNLKIGMKYLKKLLKKFDGNLIYTLAAYNAGETRVARWKRDRFNHDDPLLIIESIPYEETRNYVKLIYRNIFFYNLIYGKESKTKDDLDESFQIGFN